MSKPQRDAFASSPLSPRLGGSSATSPEWTTTRRAQQQSTRYPSRRESTTSLASSIGGSVDLSALHGRVNKQADTGQNAISTLLQPPIVRTGLLPHTSAPASSQHKPPSSRDIPPVTLTNIPHVEPSVFIPYLSHVGNLFAARQRVEAEDAASPSARREKPGSRDKQSGSYFDGVNAVEDPASIVSRAGSISGSSPVEQPPLNRRRSSGGVRRTQLAVAPLSSIPGVYFEENFRLENPRTFDIVTERSEVIRTPQPAEDAKTTNGSANGSAVAPRKALATNAILQEKLSWYLDTVEIHLISSISAASKSFFAALGSLKDLHAEAADSVAKIQSLRHDLAQLDKEMAMGRLEIVRLRQRRQNLSKLSDAMTQLHNVMKGASTCEEMVDSGKLEDTLNRISMLEAYTCGFIGMDPSRDASWLYSDPPRNLIDLRKLRALEGFGSGMNQLRARIGTGFQSRFMEALMGDLRRHYTSVNNKETLRRWASASQRARGLQVLAPTNAPAYLNSSAELREKLAATLGGLKRSRFTMTATATFREAINKEMKSIIRHNLPSSSDEDDALSITSTSTKSSRAQLSQRDKSAILARNLIALGPDDAEDLLTRTYCAVGEALRRLQVQCKLLLDVSSDATMSPTRALSRSNTINAIDGALSPPALPIRSPSPNLQQELMESLDLSSLLGQAVDVAQTQITKVLKVRAERVSQYTLPEFLRYFTLNRLFADECEAVSGRSGVALKGVINNQIHDFIPLFAGTERQNLAQRMEADRWDARDFTEADSSTLATVLSGMTTDPPSYLRVSQIWEVDGLNGTSTNGAVPPDPRNPRPAFIDDDRFILADSAIHLLHSITRFQTFITGMPAMASEISAAFLDHLKLFNSLSCQLVLGAGATRSSAALKNINTKHLALASQALSFVIALIPYVREFVRRRLAMAGSDILIEFDKVKRLLQDHQASVHEKLVDIMAAHAAAHARTFMEMDMDADWERETASPCMETMTKQTVMLHRALSKHMPEAGVQSIMEQVWLNYEERWGKAFKDKNVKTEPGKKRLLRDAELFSSKLGKLAGGEKVSKLLLTIANGKNVAVKPKVVPPQQTPEPAKPVDTEVPSSTTEQEEVIEEKVDAPDPEVEKADEAQPQANSQPPS